MKLIISVSFLIYVSSDNSFTKWDDSNISEEDYSNNTLYGNNCKRKYDDRPNELKDVERKLSRYHHYPKAKYESDNNRWGLEDVENRTKKYLLRRKSATIEDSNRSYQASSAYEESDEHEGTLTQYPYSVSIQKKGSHYATGALVGPRWVMTTAAEFYNIREILKLFRMRFGSVDCKRRGVLMPIKNVYSHPSYAPGSPAYDVALLKTPTIVPEGPAVKPIALSKAAGRVVSAKFLVTYWPRIVVKKKILPPTAKERHLHSYMRVSTQRLIPAATCRQLVNETNVTLASSTLCLRPILIHHSVCMPDVGAPVVAVDGLWGITSAWVSPLCPSKPGPTLLTRVTAMSVKFWINKMLRQTEDL